MTFDRRLTKYISTNLTPAEIHFPNLYHGEIEHKKLEWAFHGLSKKIQITLFTSINYPYCTCTLVHIHF